MNHLTEEYTIESDDHKVELSLTGVINELLERIEKLEREAK